MMNKNKKTYRLKALISRMIAAETPSKGPTFNRFLPLTDIDSWYLQPILFYFLCWLQQNFTYNR